MFLKCDILIKIILEDSNF